MNLPVYPVETQDWFNVLVEECRAIAVEFGFNARWEKIQGYHTLGKRILEENHQFERSKIYGQQIVEKLSESLGMSQRTIQYAVQFAKKYPDLNALPMGKNATWSKVIKELLPENPAPKEEVKKHICPYCGYRF